MSNFLHSGYTRNPVSHLLATVMLLAAFPLSLQASPPSDTIQTLYNEATEKLNEGYYSEALQLYHRIEHRDTVSGPLFLNLGIAYTRLDSLGKAKYYLLKAQNFPSTRSDASEGLKFINNQFSNQSAVLPRLPWDRAIDWIHDHWGTVRTFGLGLILLILAVSGILYSWFISRFSYYVNRAAKIIAAVGLITIFLSLYLNYIDYRYTRAVMTHQKTVVKERPTNDGTTISQAYEGYTFTVDLKKSRNHEGWYYVRLPNGMHGWIQQENIKLL